jgi:predicted methyltransferase
MRRYLPCALAFAGVTSLLLFACGGETPAPAAPAASAAPPPAPLASAAPASSAAPAPAEPSPEEKKKAEAQQHLTEDKAKWQEENKAEVARWTPEVRAAAKALADKTYPTLKAAVDAALKGPQRKPGDADRDKARHPLETLGFFGIKPTMTVLEVGPGEGWYTAILAPTLASKGKLIDTNTDPKGPEDQRSTFYGQRFQAFLDKSPEAFGKVQTVIIDNTAPKLGLDGTVDAVVLAREAHGMVSSGTLDGWLAEIHKALKAGGVLGIEEHRAKADADPKESAKKGYLPEKWLVDQVEAAGFKLAGKSEINANPKDTKDYPDGVWDLPPTFRAADKDREKYATIGESDRMTLKFVKSLVKSLSVGAPAPTAAGKAEKAASAPADKAAGAPAKKP